MVDITKNIKSTMDDLKKPRSQAPSRSSSLKSSLSPLAWKASLFFWRRIAKKNPPKPHVIKPSIDTSSSSSHCPPCKRAKSGPIPTKNYTNYATNNNYFYYSYPTNDHSDDHVMSNSMYGCYNVKTRSRSRQSSGCVTPTTCDDSPNLGDIEYHNTLPYFQLHHSSHVPLSGSTGRLPLYIAS